MKTLVSVVAMVAGVSVGAGIANAAGGSSFDGTWTASNPGGRTTFTTKIVVPAHTITVERSGGGMPDARIEGVFTYDSASSQITFTNKSVSTTDMGFFACLDVPGTYKVNFTDATHMTLSLVSDKCGPRTQGPGRATFTKQ